MPHDITGPVEITAGGMVAFTPQRAEYRFDPRARPHKIVFGSGDPLMRGFPEFTIVAGGDEFPAIVLPRARVERLLAAIDAMERKLTNDCGWDTSDLFQPGDRDPLP